MKLRRFLSALLVLVMVCTAIPAGALAAGGNGDPAPEAKGELFLDKTATLTDDGSYTINMEAYATGKTTTQTTEKGIPLDIVLVLDQSGSLVTKDEESGDVTLDNLTPLKNAVTSFVNKVHQNGQTHGVEHRIGIATFAGGNESQENPDRAKWDYKNTGIYDETGTFVGYEATSASKPTYQKFNGAMDTNGAYYVQLTNGDYVPLKHEMTQDSCTVHFPSRQLRQ